MDNVVDLFGAGGTSPRPDLMKALLETERQQADRYRRVAAAHRRAADALDDIADGIDMGLEG